MAQVPGGALRSGSRVGAARAGDQLWSNADAGRSWCALRPLVRFVSGVLPSLKLSRSLASSMQSQPTVALRPSPQRRNQRNVSIECTSQLIRAREMRVSIESETDETVGPTSPLVPSEPHRPKQPVTANRKRVSTDSNTTTLAGCSKKSGRPSKRSVTLDLEPVNEARHKR